MNDLHQDTSILPIDPVTTPFLPHPIRSKGGFKAPPAKSNFLLCVKIEVISESLNYGMFSHAKRLKWYHPGTGLVKSEAVEGGEDLIELVEIIPAKVE